MESISEKKKAIFESTLKLIREHGFHGAPMSLVAKNADVATGTIYHYFESKEQLICEMYSYNRNQLVEVVSKALSGTGSAKVKFFRMWKDVFDFYNQNPNLLIFFEQYVNSPFNVHKQAKDYEDRPLYDFITEGISSGTLKKVKPEILLTLIISSSISIVKLHQFGNHFLNDDDLDRIVEMIWTGISKN